MKIFKSDENFPLKIIEIGDGEDSVSEAIQKIQDEFERREGLKLFAEEIICVGNDIRSFIYSHTELYSCFRIWDMTITVKFTDNGLTGFTDEEVAEILNKEKIDKESFSEQKSEKVIENQEIKVSQCFKDKIWNFITKLVKR